MKLYLPIGLLCLSAWTVSADERPNFVVILCDDLGYGDLECYGHPHIKTPHLNQLAADGIRFTDFYSAAPVCSASRVGLLTGRSPNRAGVYDWIPSATSPKRDAREQVHMRSAETTLPRLLKNAGYATCMAGKWHCNSRFNDREQPQPGDFGFDHWLGTQNNAAPSHENPRNYVRNGQPAGRIEGFSCQIAVNEVIGWLEGREHSSPFFVFLPFHEPHEPVASPAKLVDRYSQVARTRDEAEYFANVANVDDAVGRLLAALDRLDLRDNTLIVFTSDNGPETLNRYRGANRSYGQPGPLRGMKLHTHEAGFRVVGIMNWKGQLTPRQPVSVPVSSLDFLPTFCNLANAAVPDGVKLDGINFLPALQGNTARTKPLVWVYFNALNEARVAMRDGRWKVLARLNGGDLPKLQNITTQTLPLVKAAQLTGFEIYDLSTDAREQTNLVTTRPDLLRKMSTRLEQQYQELVSSSHVWEPVVD